MNNNLESSMENKSLSKKFSKLENNWNKIINHTMWTHCPNNLFKNDLELEIRSYFS